MTKCGSVTWVKQTNGNSLHGSTPLHILWFPHDYRSGNGLADLLSSCTVLLTFCAQSDSVSFPQRKEIAVAYSVWAMGWRLTAAHWGSGSCTVYSVVYLCRQCMITLGTVGHENFNGCDIVQVPVSHMREITAERYSYFQQQWICILFQWFMTVTV